MYIYLYFFLFVKAKSRIIQVQEDFSPDVRQGVPDPFKEHCHIELFESLYEIR